MEGGREGGREEGCLPVSATTQPHSHAPGLATRPTCVTCLRAATSRLRGAEESRPSSKAMIAADTRCTWIHAGRQAGRRGRLGVRAAVCLAGRQAGRQPGKRAHGIARSTRSVCTLYDACS